MASTIGLKIANGEFYSIAEENSTVKKRLILTTVHDNQRSVQIDLYRSMARSMADAQYIGSLVVENIKPRPKGEPSIELVLSSSPDGDIMADAIDLDTGAGGEHQVLNVSLRSLDQDNRAFEIPDFELEQNEEPPSGLYGRAKEIKDDEKKKGAAGAVVIIGLILILALLAAWYFLLGGKDQYPLPFVDKLTKPTATQTAKQPEPKQAEPEPAKPEPAKPVEPKKEEPPPPPPPPPKAEPTPPPVIQAPTTPPPARPQQARRDRPPAPVSSYKVPATIPPEGAPYKLRWGDTLWDISEAFYRNPWLYPRIARFNNIRNPDLIISGTTIMVPPKN